jgi:hypothetical protein
VAVGNKEDISDIITNIAPHETPFYSGWRDMGATATNHEWLEDTLRAPITNSKVEGFEYAVTDPTPRVRLGNYTQIFSHGYIVTKTQEVVSKHGLDSEKGYQMAKAMKEIALDVENAIITQAMRNAGNVTTARVFGGIPYWIATNVIDANNAPLTEDIFNTALQQCWQVGGNPRDAYMSGLQKRVVSSWSGDGDKYLAQNDKKLVQAINVYESDFGIVRLHPHRLMPDASVYIIDKTYWKLASLRKMKTEKLPNTGDNWKQVIVGELTIEARAEKASALIKKLKTT